MKRTKLLATILALCMVMSIFVGCADESEKEDSSSNKKDDTISNILDMIESEMPTSENPTSEPLSTLIPDLDSDLDLDFDFDFDFDSDSDSDSDSGSDSDSDFDFGPTTVYDGIEFTTLPYESDGITVNSISLSENRLYANVTNNTDMTLASITSVKIKIYYPTHSEPDNDSLYLEYLSPGESAVVDFYLEEKPTKILFYGTDIYEAESSFEDVTTSVYDGLTVNQLPFESNGILFENCYLKDNYMYIKITNNTGHAIADFSSILYKSYNQDGFVHDSDPLFFEHLNNGESALIDLYLDEGTSKIIFGASNVSEADEIIIDSTTESNGLITNVLPYSENGLILTSVTLDDDKLLIGITNQTGSTTGEYA